MKRGKRLLLSAASGVAAAVLAFAYASSVKAEAERAQREAIASYGEELVAVCVATRDIEPGEELDEGNIAMEDWVASLLPPDAALSIDGVAGRVATSRIPKRAAICPAYVEERDEGIEVPRGKVAVSVPSDAEHAVGGALARGDLVDVYVSRDSISDRLAQGRVIDTSALAGAGAQMTWVTLAVDPAVVPEVLAATTAGTVTLVLPAESAARVEKEE